MLPPFWICTPDNIKLTLPRAGKEHGCKSLIYSLIPFIFSVFPSFSPAQPTSDQLLARSAIQILDTLSFPVQKISWNLQDSALTFQTLSLQYANLEYSRLGRSQLIRTFSAAWTYTDSLQHFSYPDQYTDTLLKSQYAALKPIVFRDQLLTDKPFALHRYLLPGLGLSVGFLLISGLFYFRTQ